MTDLRKRSSILFTQEKNTAESELPYPLEQKIYYFRYFIARELIPQKFSQGDEIDRVHQLLMILENLASNKHLHNPKQSINLIDQIFNALQSLPSSPVFAKLMKEGKYSNEDYLKNIKILSEVVQDIHKLYHNTQNNKPNKPI